MIDNGDTNLIFSMNMNESCTYTLPYLPRLSLSIPIVTGGREVEL